MKVQRLVNITEDVYHTDELIQTLRIRYKFDYGSFWLYDADFPALSIGIRDKYAWLNYFESDESPGWLSQAEDGCNLQDIEFLDHDASACIRPGSCVISTTKAEDAAIEFFETLKLPACTRWLEL